MPHFRTDNSTLGVLLMSLAAFLWVLHGAISKWVMQDYSIYQVLLLRTVFSLLPIMIVLRHEGGTVRLRGGRVWVCLGRGCLAVACFALFLAALPLMAATGLLAGSAQYCLTEAFRIASPSLVAPFEYTSLPWAMLFGFLVWGTFPQGSFS